MANSSRIAVDFDGVLHSYASGWEGADVINDPPTHWPTIDELAAMTPWWWKGKQH